MANRRFEQFCNRLEKKVVDLYLKVSFAASGAPTIVRGKGIAQIQRTAAGKYTITLGRPQSSTDPAAVDTYQALLHASHAFVVASGAPASPSMFVVADNAASGTIQIEFNASGTATDPASGEAVLIHLALSNSAI